MAWSHKGSILGPQGDSGTRGPKGDTGEDGLSAYEVAVDNGFVGTEEDWLESLKGEPGSGGASMNPVPIVANYTASVGDFVVPMAVGLTVTLPGSADHGDTVRVFNPDPTDLTVSYFSLFIQSAATVVPGPETLSTFLYVADVDLGAGPMSGWYLLGQWATADVPVNPRFTFLDETTWGSTTPEADRTYLVFED